MKSSWKNWPKSGAILLLGPALEELTAEALLYAKELLVGDAPRSEALLEAKAHPDFRRVESGEGTRPIIKIDQIRELIEWSLGKPQIAERKIAVLAPAEALNLQAANAFLKTLEEPNPTTLFILVGSRINALPATVISRCHVIRNRIPERAKTNIDANFMGDSFKDDEVNTLKEEINKGLLALKNGQTDPVSLSAVWHKKDVPQIVYGILLILLEKTKTAALSGKIMRSKDAWEMIDSVIEARKTLMDFQSANTQLLLESLLIQYNNLGKPVVK